MHQNKPHCCGQEHFLRLVLASQVSYFFLFLLFYFYYYIY